MADSLRQYFGRSNFTFIVSSTVTHTVREIHSTWELEEEVQKARIYAGIHYRHSVVEGADLGRKVALQAFGDFFQPEATK